MNKNSKIAGKINQIGNEVFEKLKDLQIPPYPKYYHDTFMDILVDSNDSEIIDMSKKYKYLFLDDEIDQNLKEGCLKITKDS
ncbi:MAG: GGDEF domain-containing protein, partial [Epsilonproteobacteria bacterium]|nr:GGDEF domain-containing protein [Campylobacterota bacterium]